MEGYFTEVVTQLALESTHFTVSWIHYWKEKGEFQFAVVQGEQIIPIYKDGLKRDLKAVLRMYVDEDKQGENQIVFEYWNDKKMWRYSQKGNGLKVFKNQEEKVWRQT